MSTGLRLAIGALSLSAVAFVGIMPTREAWLDDPRGTGKMLLNILYGAIVALALVAVVAVLWLAMMDWPSPKPAIVAMALPPVVCPIDLPPPAKAPNPIKNPPERATEIIATQAMSTPAGVINNPEIEVKQHAKPEPSGLARPFPPSPPSLPN